MKRMTKLAAVGAGLALVAGIAVATPALAATTAPTDGTASSCTWPGQVWSKLPADLQNDLRDAKNTTPGPDRAAAFEAIRTKALAGDYGDVVEHFAEAHPGLGIGLWQNAPQQLKDDVHAALQLTGDDRKAAFEEIGRKAVAGDYGTAVQTRAQQVRNAPWWPDCAG